MPELLAKVKPATASNLPREIELLEQAGAFLVQCQDVDEVKLVRDKAEALRLYAKKRGGLLEAQNTAASIKIEAECRIGELLDAGLNHKGGRPKKNGSLGKPFFELTSLAEIGITKKASHCFQTMSTLLKPERDKIKAKVVNDKKELTSKLIYQKARELQRQSDRAEAIETAKTIEGTGDIHEGDLCLIEDLIADDSADLFFTDPPYHEDKTSLFGQLAEIAQHKLKPGGLCLVYSGQMFLPAVLAEMSKHLDYYWIFALRHMGGHLQIWNRHIWNDWKPVLVFAKRPIQTPSHEWAMDFQEGGGRDKQFHDWGQDAAEATYWIEMFTKPGELVVDPFCGGGAIPAACKATGRRWLATEIDSGNAALARSRVQ